MMNFTTKKAIVENAEMVHIQRLALQIANCVRQEEHMSTHMSISLVWTAQREDSEHETHNSRIVLIVLPDITSTNQEPRSVYRVYQANIPTKHAVLVANIVVRVNM